MKKINFDKHIWEGWTVRNFIDELQPVADLIQNGQSWHKPFKTKEEIKKWTMDHQPYYKRAIPDVIKYFCLRYHINDGRSQNKGLLC